MSLRKHIFILYKKQLIMLVLLIYLPINSYAQIRKTEFLDDKCNLQYKAKKIKQVHAYFYSNKTCLLLQSSRYDENGFLLEKDSFSYDEQGFFSKAFCTRVSYESNYHIQHEIRYDSVFVKTLMRYNRKAFFDFSKKMESAVVVDTRSQDTLHYNYAYNEHNHVVSIDIRLNGKLYPEKISYIYNPNGKIKQEKLEGSIITNRSYIYNTNHLLYKIYGEGICLAQFEYDNANNLIKEIADCGIKNENDEHAFSLANCFKYDKKRRLKSHWIIDHSLPGKEQVIISKKVYCYKINGLLKQQLHLTSNTKIKYKYSRKT